MKGVESSLRTLPILYMFIHIDVFEKWNSLDALCLNYHKLVININECNSRIVFGNYI